MKIDDKFRDEKIECNINREAAKILALSSGKIDKYEFFTGKQILPNIYKYYYYKYYYYRKSYVYAFPFYYSI